MSKQVIVWSLLILPWFSLFFLKRDEIRRFMPLALFTMVVTSIVQEAGISLNLWQVRATTYPLNQTMSYIYGLAPVVSIWIFKYTYGRFWRYMAVDALFNLGFAFIFTPWLASRGIKDFNTSRWTLFLIVTVLSLLLYLYQMWQENAWANRRAESYELQPAQKPLPRPDGDEK
ncbi:MAG: hypothetical protein ABFD04_01495 [Syntrophomonas sp.]